MTTLTRLVRSPSGASVAVAAIALAGIVVVVLGGGYDLARSASALWTGSFGSAYSLLSGTLVRSVPLMIAGLSVAIAFQAGVLNIGAEGQLLVGASAAVAAGLALNGEAAWMVIPAECAAGAAAGAMWAAVAAILRRRFGVLEVISTLMLNYVALYLVSYLVRGPLQEPTHVYPYSTSLGPSARLPLILPGQQLHAGFLVALGCAATAWWFFRFAAGGFRARAVGAGAPAAASSGKIDVERVIFRTFLVSGAIAGLGGAVQATGVTYALYEGISPGYGYTAIAVALLARLNPLAVVLSGIFFGGLEAGGAAMQRDAGVPLQFVAVVEAFVVLGVLAVDRARESALQRAPAPLEDSAP